MCILCSIVVGETGVPTHRGGDAGMPVSRVCVLCSIVVGGDVSQETILIIRGLSTKDYQVHKIYLLIPPC